MFHRLLGWRVPIAFGQASSSGDHVGQNKFGVLNRVKATDRRGFVWKEDAQTSVMSAEDAATLTCLTSGRGWFFPFDRDAFSTNGVGPDTAGANYTIKSRTTSSTGNGMFGVGYLSTIDEVIYDLELPEKWTVLVFTNVEPRLSAVHKVLRSDGRTFENGVEVSSVFSEFYVDTDIGALVLAGGFTFDSMLVLPCEASESFIVDFYRWHTQFGLVFDVDFRDGCGIDRRRNMELMLERISTVTIEKTGLRSGGCMVVDANTERGVYDDVNVYSINSQDEFTVQCWIHLHAGSTRTTRVIMHDQDSPVTSGWRFDLRAAHAPNRWALQAQLETASGTASHSSPTTPTDAANTVGEGVDTHVAFTWTKTTGVVQLYINGVAVTRAEGFFENQPAQAPSADSADLLIGNVTGTGLSQLDGRIGGIRIHRLAMTATEIRESFLARIEGAPHEDLTGGAPLPFLTLCGASTAWRTRYVLPEFTSSRFVQHGPRNASDTWRNNSEIISYSLEQREPTIKKRALRPLWAFTLDERFVDDTGLILRPSSGSFAAASPSSVWSALGKFEPGAYGHGRARRTGSGAVFDLSAEHVQALAGLRSCTVLAWVRRGNTDGGILSLGHTSTNKRIELLIDPSFFPQIDARGASTDGLGSISSSIALANAVDWHLVGGFVDVHGDRMGVFVDDAGLGNAPIGGYETSPVTFASSEFSREASATNSGIGFTGAKTAIWSGAIAYAAVFDGILTAEQVYEIFDSGRRSGV